jgi:hypothetical protein
MAISKVCLYLLMICDYDFILFISFNRIKHLMSAQANRFYFIDKLKYLSLNCCQYWKLFFTMSYNFSTVITIGKQLYYNINTVSKHNGSVSQIVFYLIPNTNLSCAILQIYSIQSRLIWDRLESMTG